jgi:hypothetical protein
MINLSKYIESKVKDFWERRGVRVCICVAIIVLLAVSILLPSDYWSSKISSFIQALAIITLVAVTWFYAKQTRELAKEQKKALREITNKRNIDFLERRIREFYGPFSDSFDVITNMIEHRADIGISAENHFRLFYALMRDKEYMVSEEMRKKICDMIPVMEKARAYAYASKEIKDNFLDLAKELERALNKEKEKIVNQIKEFYSILEG